MFPRLRLTRGAEVNRRPVAGPRKDPPPHARRGTPSTAAACPDAAAPAAGANAASTAAATTAITPALRTSVSSREHYVSDHENYRCTRAPPPGRTADLTRTAGTASPDKRFWEIAEVSRKPEAANC